MSDILTITIPYTVETRGAFLAIAEHASRDNVTPVICSIKLTAEGLIATDRYSIGRYDFAKDTPVTDDAPAIVVPAAELVKWIKSLTLPKRMDCPSSLRFTVSGARVLVELVWGVEDHLADEPVTAIALDTLTGNYPPVLSLFPNVLAETMIPCNLSVKSLAKLVAAGKHLGDKDPVIRFDQVVPHRDSTRHGTIVAEVPNLDTGRFTMLIQPNLRLR